MNLPKILRASKCIAMVHQFATVSCMERCNASPLLAGFSASNAPALKVAQKARRRGGGHGARGVCWPLVIDDQRNSLNTSISRARRSQKARSPSSTTGGMAASANRSKACLWPASPYVLPDRRPMSRRLGRARIWCCNTRCSGVGRVNVRRRTQPFNKHQPTMRVNT